MQSGSPTAPPSSLGSSNDPLFRCGRCQKDFGRMDHLQRHVRTHTQEKPYACPVCGKSFARTDILKRHAESHSSTNAPPKKRKRLDNVCHKRVSQACKACATSKLKCAEERPCVRCKLKNLVCEYNSSNDDVTRSTTKSKDPENEDEVDEGLGLDLPDPSIDFQVDHSFGQGHQPGLEHEVINPSNDTSYLPTDVSMTMPYDPEAQSILNNNIAPAHIVDSGFPYFLRDLLLPDSYRQDFTDANQPDTTVSGLLQDFDIGIDHNFDDWNLSAFDLPDGRSNLGAADSSHTANENAAQAPSPEDRAFAAGARAFRNSIWHWIPLDKDSAVANQADLKFSEDPRENHIEKLQMPARHKLDHATRDKVFAMILGSCDPTSMPRLISSFPSRSFMERNLHAFIQLHKRRWDTWIHLPTFEIRKASPALVATAFATGATMAPVSAIQNFGYALHEVLRIAIPAIWERNNSTTRDLQTLQSYAIHLHTGLWSGDRRKMEISESFAQVLVTMLRRAGWYHRSRYKIIRPTEEDEGVYLEEIWHNWICQESWKRLVYHMFSQGIQSSMTRMTVPLISYSELSLPLPESNELWFAETASQWKALCMQETGPFSPNTLSLAECIRDTLDEGLPVPVRNDPNLATHILHGLWGLIWEYRQSYYLFRDKNSSGGNSALLLPARHQALVRALNDFKLVFVTLGTDNSKASSQNDLIRVLLVEYLLMAVYVPLEDIEIFAGKYGDHEARRIYPLLQEWSQTRDARQGMWHAGQVLTAAASLPIFRMRNFFAVATYHTSLSMWAYGMITGATLLRQQQQEPGVFRNGVQQQSTNGTPSFWLTDPGESIDLQRWLSLQIGSPGIRLPSKHAAYSTYTQHHQSSEARLKKSSPQEVDLQQNEKVNNHQHHDFEENIQHQAPIALLQNPESVMKVATCVLCPDMSASLSLSNKPPLVKNIGQLMTEIGAAARIVGL